MSPSSPVNHGDTAGARTPTHRTQPHTVHSLEQSALTEAESPERKEQPASVKLSQLAVNEAPLLTLHVATMSRPNDSREHAELERRQHDHHGESVKRLISTQFKLWQTVHERRACCMSAERAAATVTPTTAKKRMEPVAMRTTWQVVKVARPRRSL